MLTLGYLLPPFYRFAYHVCRFEAGPRHLTLFLSEDRSIFQDGTTGHTLSFGKRRRNTTSVPIEGCPHVYSGLER